MMWIDGMCILISMMCVWCAFTVKHIHNDTHIQIHIDGFDILPAYFHKFPEVPVTSSTIAITVATIHWVAVKHFWVFPVASSCLVSIYACSQRLSIPTSEEGSQWYAFTLMIFNNQRDGRVVSKKFGPWISIFPTRKEQNRPFVNSFPFFSWLRTLNSWSITPNARNFLELTAAWRRIFQEPSEESEDEDDDEDDDDDSEFDDDEVPRHAKTGMRTSQKDPNIGKR